MGSRTRDISALLCFVAVTSWLTLRLATGVGGSPDALLNYWALAWNFHILPNAPSAYDRIPEPRRRRSEAEMDRYRERTPLLSRIGDDAVYEIVDAPS